MITIENVKHAVTLEYLVQLEKWVDTDISNVGKDSDVIKQMKAKMHGLSVEELDEKQLKDLTDLKNAIQKRITELKNK